MYKPLDGAVTPTVSDEVVPWSIVLQNRSTSTVPRTNGNISGSEELTAPGKTSEKIEREKAKQEPGVKESFLLGPGSKS